MSPAARHPFKKYRLERRCSPCHWFGPPRPDARLSPNVTLSGRFLSEIRLCRKVQKFIRSSKNFRERHSLVLLRQSHHGPCLISHPAPLSVGGFIPSDVVAPPPVSYNTYPRHWLWNWNALDLLAPCCVKENPILRCIRCPLPVSESMVRSCPHWQVSVEFTPSPCASGFFRLIEMIGWEIVSLPCDWFILTCSICSLIQ